MNMLSDFLFAKDSTVAVLGIPYKNSESHMFIFLPIDPSKLLILNFLNSFFVLYSVHAMLLFFRRIYEL